ncbi:MAG TPA: MBL fold metallo-hydrolase [Armatimonadota bacterium]|nr:MBL fold metallo-hydrolase [Armatimonadota bacterium]
MSIELHVLGGAGRDNALLVYVHTGQAVVRLLFDCGEGCLASLPFVEIQRIDHLFFSHLHMDHIGGFDSFFRCTYNRTRKPNVIWGPPDTARIIQHRLCGFLWNLHEDKQATWHVCDILPEEIACMRFELTEAFASAHAGEARPNTGVVLGTPDLTVEALSMNHLTPSLAYIVREKPRLNIDVRRLGELGLQPGPWLQSVKTAPPTQATIAIDGKPYPLAQLRSSLLVETPGDSIAYLTDFLLDDAAVARLVPALHGCRIVVCESAYLAADTELAERNYHMTAPRVAALAKLAEVGQLVLIHLSERYTPDEWPVFLQEAREIFPNTHFPKVWGIT